MSDMPNNPRPISNEEKNEFVSLVDAVAIPGMMMIYDSMLPVLGAAFVAWLAGSWTVFVVLLGALWLVGSFFIVKKNLPVLPDDASEHRRALRVRHIRWAPITYLIFSFWGLIGLMSVIIYWLYSIQCMMFRRR